MKQEVKHVYDYKKDKEIVAVVHQIGDKKHVVERHYNHRSGRVQDHEFYESVEKCEYLMICPVMSMHGIYNWFPFQAMNGGLTMNGRNVL